MSRLLRRMRRLEGDTSVPPAAIQAAMSQLAETGAAPPGRAGEYARMAQEFGRQMNAVTPDMSLPPCIVTPPKTKAASPPPAKRHSTPRVERMPEPDPRESDRQAAAWGMDVRGRRNECLDLVEYEKREERRRGALQRG